MHPSLEADVLWGCSRLSWETNGCNYSAEDIQQLKNHSNGLVSFGAYSLVVLAETGLWKEKGGWREQKVAAGQGGCSRGEVKISRVMVLCKGWVSGEE